MQYTRITTRYTSESIVNNLLSNRSKLVDLQTQISSGKRITKVSDDVLAGISVVSTSNSLGKIDNYLKNISNAQGELDVTDKTLTSLVDIVQKARELTVQAANATTGPNELQSINAEIQQIIEQVKNIGNTKYGTKYIFGGLQTDSPPFAVPSTGEIQYTGSPNGSHQRDVEVNDGITVTINVSGDQIFGEYYTGDHDNDPMTPDTLEGSGLLQTLITLSTELGAANPDKDVIRQHLDNLDTDLQTVINAQAQLGGVSNRLEMTKSILEDNQTNLTKIKSGAEDIDLAKAISDLQFQQSSLQASLQVSSQIIQPSLLDYI